MLMSNLPGEVYEFIFKWLGTNEDRINYITAIECLLDQDYVDYLERKRKKILLGKPITYGSFPYIYSVAIHSEYRFSNYNSRYFVRFRWRNIKWIYKSNEGDPARKYRPDFNSPLGNQFYQFSMNRNRVIKDIIPATENRRRKIRNYPFVVKHFIPKE